MSTYRKPHERLRIELPSELVASIRIMLADNKYNKKRLTLTQLIQQALADKESEYLTYRKENHA
jgi:hypothetical protein